jgi:hypothetical protein
VRGHQINNDIWMMLEKCWDAEPNRRPQMATLSRFFALQMTLTAAQHAQLY